MLINLPDNFLYLLVLANLINIEFSVLCGNNIKVTLRKCLGDFERKTGEDSEKGKRKETGRSTRYLKPKDVPGKPNKKVKTMAYSIKFYATLNIS